MKSVPLDKERSTMRKLGVRALACGLAALLVAGVGAPAVANAEDVLLVAAPDSAKTLYITEDMVDSDGEVVISGEDWDRVVIAKEAAAKDIYFDQVTIGELVVESGSSSRIQLWEVDADKLTVKEPELPVLSLSELRPLLTDPETQKIALDMYIASVNAIKTVQAKGPSIVTKEDAKVGEVVARANVSFDFEGGNVGPVALEASEIVERVDVTLKNYDGEVSYKGADAFSVLSLKALDSNISKLTVDESAANNYFNVSSKNSVAQSVDVAGNANVSLKVAMGELEIAETATAAKVAVLDKVDVMNVEADNAKVEIGPAGNVAVANVIGDKVNIGGGGILTEAEITGKGAYVSTGGTKVDGENTFVPAIGGGPAEVMTDVDFGIAELPLGGGWGYEMSSDGGINVSLVGGYSGEVFYVLPEAIDASYYDKVVIKVKTDGEPITVKLTAVGASLDSYGNPVPFFSQSVSGEATIEVPLALHAGKMIDQVRFQSGSNAVSATLRSISFELNEDGPNEVLVAPEGGILCTPNQWEIVAFQDIDFRDLAGKTVKITLDAIRLGGDSNPIAHGQFGGGDYTSINWEKEIGTEWTNFGTEAFEVPESWADKASKIYYGIRCADGVDYNQYLIYYRNFSVEEVKELPDDFTLDITGATKCTTDSYQVHHFTDVDLRKYPGATISFSVDMAKYGGDETVEVKAQTSTTYQSIGENAVIGNDWDTYTGTYLIPADVVDAASAVYLGFRWNGQNNNYADYMFYYKNFEYTVVVPDAVEIEDKDSISTLLEVDDELELEATASGDDDIKWTSSNTSVATVDANGKVTAKKEGTVKITATYGTATDEITLTVIDYLSIDGPESYTLNEGDTVQLKATTSGVVTWSTSNADIATVSSDGLVTAVSGSAVEVTITATCGEETEVSDSVKVTVVVPGQKYVTIADVADKTLFVGKTKQLSATPSDEDGVVTWSAAPESIATVDQTGKVTANTEGNVGDVVITAKYEDATATVTLNVKDYSVTINKAEDYEGTSIYVDDTVELKATTVTDEDVEWTSSNTSVATVVDGVVKAKAAGNVKITVKTGGKEASVNLTVIAPIVAYDFESDKGSVSEYGAAVDVVDTTKFASGALKVPGNWNSVATFTATLPEGKTLADFTGLKFDFYGNTDPTAQEGLENTSFKDAYVYAAAEDATMEYVEGGYLATVQTGDVADAWGTSSFTFDEGKLAALSGIEAGATIQLGIGINCGIVYYIDNVYLVDAEGEYLIQDFDSTTPTVGGFGQYTNPDVVLVNTTEVLAATLDELGDKVLQIANANWGQGVTLKFVLPKGKTIANYSGLQLSVWLPSNAEDAEGQPNQKFDYKYLLVDAWTEEAVLETQDWWSTNSLDAWTLVEVESWDTLTAAIGDATTFYITMGINTPSPTPYYIDNVTLVEAE